MKKIRTSIKFLPKTSLRGSFILFFLVIGPSLWAQESTTYYLIRHAEKDRVNPGNSNPHLTKKGKQRAQYWNKVFEGVVFDCIYSTPFFRTIETIKPTALQQQLPIFYYDMKRLYNDEFKDKNRGKTVLVVGHSNTTPHLANAILKKEVYPEINDRVNGLLYIIHVRGEIASGQVLSID